CCSKNENQEGYTENHMTATGLRRNAGLKHELSSRKRAMSCVALLARCSETGQYFGLLCANRSVRSAVADGSNDCGMRIVDCGLWVVWNSAFRNQQSAIV